MTCILAVRFIPLAIVILLISICSGVDSLSCRQQQQQQQQQISSRRIFVSKAATAATVVFLPGLRSLIPESASAYERRDVGDGSRSAATAAFNEQAYQTNSRLEKEGFKLDTREEEKAKLSEAMASFSYESSSSTSKKKTGSTSAKAKNQTSKK
jgi:hypothetical protein